jgi:hypothetical protein
MQPGKPGNSGRQSRRRLSSHRRRRHRRPNLLSRPLLARQHRPNRRQAALERPKVQILQRRRLEWATRSRPSSLAHMLHGPSKILPEWEQQCRTRQQRSARQDQPLPGPRNLALRSHHKPLHGLRQPNRVKASRNSPLRHDLRPSLHSLNHQQMEPDRPPLRTPNRASLFRLMKTPNLADRHTRDQRPLHHSRRAAS